MDIAVLNYPTGEVDVIRGLDDDVIQAQYEGDIEEYLDDCGYNIHAIHYMCADEIVIND